MKVFICQSYDTTVLLGDINGKVGRGIVGSASVSKHSLYKVSTARRAELRDLENLWNRNEARQFYKKLKGQVQGFKASSL